jgi:hypothetical protein
MASMMTRARDAFATNAMRAIAAYAVTSSVPAVLAALITPPPVPVEPSINRERIKE